MGTYYLRHNLSSTSVPTRSIRLDLDGGELTSRGGYLSTRNTGHTGEIVIFNVGTIAMTNGYIETASANTPSGYSRNAGAITIGQDGGDGPRAGPIQVARLDAHSARGTGGAITVHSTGDVLVQDNSGVAGDIITGRHPDWTTGETRAIAVAHHGSFRAASVSAERVLSTAPGTRYDVAFNGGVLGGNPGGSFTANSIRTRAWLSSAATNHRNIPAGHVVIQNYGSVSVDEILTHTASYHASWRNSGPAGNITVTNVKGDIVIDSLDASSNASGNPVGSRGVLVLAAQGKIRLGTLDMSKVNNAQVDSGGKESLIVGQLLGFATDGSGDGTRSNPVVTTQTALRTPSGQFIYYDPAVNSYLNNKVYKVADLVGNAGQGGLLMPRGEQGTLFMVR